MTRIIVEEIESTIVLQTTIFVYLMMVLIHYCTQPLIVLLSRLIDQLPIPFVICGDFNGHSITWGCDKNNSRGDRIDNCITDNNICLLNDGSYTLLYPTTRTFTAIDLSLCSPKILKEIDVMVESDSYDSDHFPIILQNGVSLPDALPR